MLLPMFCPSRLIPMPEHTDPLGVPRKTLLPSQKAGPHSAACGVGDPLEGPQEPLPRPAFCSPQILIPALMVTAEKDFVLPPEMSKHMEKWVRGMAGRDPMGNYHPCV